MKRVDNSKNEKISQVPFYRRLDWTLLMSFLVLSLIPMLVVSIISNQNAYDSIREKTEKTLISVAEGKTREIDTYFKGIIIDLQLQAEMDTNTRLISELADTFSASEIQLVDFVKSYRWELLVDEQAGDLKKFRQTYGYQDIFLIDTKGNILFTIAEADDLGTNLFHGPDSGTLLADACLRALETGDPAFSDYDKYTLSGRSKICAFVVDIIVNDAGEKVGLIAFQIPIGSIDTIMQTKIGLGKTAEAYLIGPDKKMRSNSILNEEKTVLGNEIITEQTKLWEQQIGIGTAVEKKGNSAFIYTGPHLKQVLGIYRNINICSVPFGVIVEIEKGEAFASITKLRNISFGLLSITGILVALIAVIISRHIVRPVLTLTATAGRVAGGDLDQVVENESRNEIGALTSSFNEMIGSLRRARDEDSEQNWYKTGQTKLNDQLHGDHGMAALSRNIITFLAEYLSAQVGAIYIAGENGTLRLTGSYAYGKDDIQKNKFDSGEGMIGQAALGKEIIILTKIPDNYIAISSGLGKTTPRNIILLPFIRDGKVIGVIELGSIHDFSERGINFLNLVTDSIAIAIHSEESRSQVRKLLEQTQIQQSELQTANRGLKAQAESLKKSETHLQTQQEELRQTNEELEEQTRLLEKQKEKIRKKNLELEETRALIEEKAEDLELTNKYKSEFLANMSHELRTPLNSIMLLSKLLYDNKGGEMTGKQVEFSRTIYSSGVELLGLINEILDLSKVESGKMLLHLEDIGLRDIVGTMERNFNPVARDKGISLNIDLTAGLPEYIRTDQQRIEQILKNLLSNAFKFTDSGSVILCIGRPEHETDLSKSGLNPEKAIAFSVTDTGVGIPKEKHEIIFEAFQQADGTTSRKFGGTGLGLSISRVFSGLLGGELHLKSEKGQGSTFILYVPEHLKDPEITEVDVKNLRLEYREDLVTRIPGKKENPQSVKQNRDLSKDFIRDDRKTMTPETKSILIIEDDPSFARILRDVSQEKGFKVLVAGDGETGLHFADYYKPSGIILDIGLPGMDGWTVMSRLKDDPKTRHIPVHFISAIDKSIDAMKMGAVGYFTKPVSLERLDQAFKKIDRVISKPVKNLLIVEDDEMQQMICSELLGDSGVKVTVASTGREAGELLKMGDFDCMVLDIDLPDISGVELLSRIRKKEEKFPIPVIVYTGKELTKKEKTTLNNYSESIIIKGEKSPAKLLDETTLFLHRVESDLPKEKKEMLRMIHEKESILGNKKILVVDDDMRNVFALTSLLEEKGMKVIVGKNGKQVLKRLEKDPDIDLVLMDIMMPEMNGYDAMKVIRKQEKYKKLPIIALTAKAMKGDRKKCIEAGASDYLAKPVNSDKLFSMLRVWLY